MFERDAEITGHREVVPGTFLMTLHEPSVAERARPGQFVMVRVGSGMDPLLRRPFSICGRFDQSFGVLYRLVGRGTSLLSKKRPGDRVQVLGPLGSGFRTEKALAPLLLTGGGIGLAPLFFLGQALHARGEEGFVLLAGFSGQAEQLSAGDVLGLDLRAEVATDDGTLGHAGTVTDLLEGRLAELGGEGKAGTVFACGPPAMLEQVAALARGAGVACQVSLEAAMACGMGACLGCVVPAASPKGTPYVRVCTEGPVFDAEDVEWTRMPAMPEAVPA